MPSSRHSALGAPSTPLLLALFAAACSCGAASNGCHSRAAPAEARASATARAEKTRLPSHRIADAVRKRGRAIFVGVLGARDIRRGDHVDVHATLYRPVTRSPVAQTKTPRGLEPGATKNDKARRLISVLLLQNVIVLSVDRVARKVALLVLPEEAELLAHAANGVAGARLSVAHRNPEDTSVIDSAKPMSIGDLLRSKRCDATSKRLRLAPPAAKHSSRVPPKRSRALSLQVSGLEIVHEHDRIDLMLTLRSPLTGQHVTITLASDVYVARRHGKQAVVWVSPTQARALSLAQRAGRLFASLRHADDVSTSDEPRPTTTNLLVTGERPTRGPSRCTPPLEVIKRIRTGHDHTGHDRAKTKTR